MASDHAQVVSNRNTSYSLPACGHESLHHVDQLGLFTSFSHMSSIQRSQLAVPTPRSGPTGQSYVSQPSGIEVTPAMDSSHSSMMLAAQHRASDVMRKSEKLRPRGEATLKCRIVCYQWT
ncbi:hypothetical protein J3459_011573 [Metarhizium acridum]|nr:hypothetical protein J3459_011573 [Metarhizium acridum]